MYKYFIVYTYGKKHKLQVMNLEYTVDNEIKSIQDIREIERYIKKTYHADASHHLNVKIVNYILI